MRAPPSGLPDSTLTEVSFIFDSIISSNGNIDIPDSKACA